MASIFWRPIPWRPIAGPAITLVLAGLMLLADRYLFSVPNPGNILSRGRLLRCTRRDRLRPRQRRDLVWTCRYPFLSPWRVVSFHPDNFGRLVVLTVCTPAIVIMIGMMHVRAQRAFKRERAANKELKPLRSALDQSDVGVVVLDSELRAQFINRAFRRLWRLPDNDADRKPTFADIIVSGTRNKGLRRAHGPNRRLHFRTNGARPRRR
jgi:PAS domain-containing protein